MASCLEASRLSSPYPLLLCVFAAFSVQAGRLEPQPDHAIRERQTTPAASPLVDFQVYEPVLTPSGSSDQYGCIHTQLLMDHVFGFSYGKPFVGTSYPGPLRPKGRIDI